MQAALPRILVVGGNGFLGSAVCKAALARGMKVTSISSSGKPFRTPKGHTPTWVSKVDWRTADALKPETYAHILPEMTAVVHTLGTLLEDTQYKKALSKGIIPALTDIAASTLRGNRVSSNPLDGEGRPNSYETLNREAAICVFEAFVSSTPDVSVNGPRPFVYVSAEDIFRPFIPERYIETKREAEALIGWRVAEVSGYRAVYIRPGLIYHPHLRPLTSPIAVMVDLSASVLRRVPKGLFPANWLMAPVESVMNTFKIPPVHVDHVAEAICIAADTRRVDVQGVVDTAAMRDLIGWSQKGRAQNDAHVRERMKE